MEQDLLRVIAIGILSLFLIIVFRNVKNEYSLIISVAAAILIFSYVIIRINAIKKVIEGFSEYISADSKYIAILLKMTGITYVAEFCASLCKDAGSQTLASQIEIFAKVSILVLGLPVITALLETISSVF